MSNTKNKNTMKNFTDIKPSTLLSKDIDNWFMTQPKEGQTHFFFYTNLTKTGRMSGIHITLVSCDGGSKIYSKRKSFDFTKLLPAKVALADRNLSDDYIVEYLDEILSICLKNGQKVF